MVFLFVFVNETKIYNILFISKCVKKIIIWRHKEIIIKRKNRKRQSDQMQLSSNTRTQIHTEKLNNSNFLKEIMSQYRTIKLIIVMKKISIK